MGKPGESLATLKTGCPLLMLSNGLREIFRAVVGPLSGADTDHGIAVVNGDITPVDADDFSFVQVLQYA